jgi:hypothetical protein
MFMTEPSNKMSVAIAPLIDIFFPMFIASASVLSAIIHSDEEYETETESIQVSEEKDEESVSESDEEKEENTKEEKNEESTTVGAVVSNQLADEQQKIEKQLFLQRKMISDKNKIIAEQSAALDRLTLAAPAVTERRAASASRTMRFATSPDTGFLHRRIRSPFEIAIREMLSSSPGMTVRELLPALTSKFPNLIKKSLNSELYKLEKMNILKYSLANGKSTPMWMLA